MSDYLFQSVDNLSGLAILGIFVISLLPLIKVLAKFLDKKINNGISPDIYDKLNIISNDNHHQILGVLQEIRDIVYRTDNKISRVIEGIEIIKERTKKL
jgi:hypothetical protein